MRGIHRSPVNSPHRGQWRGALMFSLICTWTNGSANNLDARDLRRHCSSLHCNVFCTCPHGSVWIYNRQIQILSFYQLMWAPKGNLLYFKFHILKTIPLGWPNFINFSIELNKTKYILSHFMPTVSLCMMTSSNGNIFCVTDHLCEEFTGPPVNSPFCVTDYLCEEFTGPPVNSPHKGQWRGALMFSLICAWINRWVNNGEAGDLRLYCAHYDVIVMGGGGGYKASVPLFSQF